MITLDLLAKAEAVRTRAKSRPPLWVPRLVGCRICGQKHVQKNGKDWWCDECKPIRAKIRRLERYERNHEHILEVTRAWRNKNRERFNANMRAWRKRTGVDANASRKRKRMRNQETYKYQPAGSQAEVFCDSTGTDDNVDRDQA